jgi:hypothetical protein
VLGTVTDRIAAPPDPPADLDAVIGPRLALHLAASGPRSNPPRAGS